MLIKSQSQSYVIEETKFTYKSIKYNNVRED